MIVYSFCLDQNNNFVRENVIVLKLPINLYHRDF